MSLAQPCQKGNNSEKYLILLINKLSIKRKLAYFVEKIVNNEVIYNMRYKNVSLSTELKTNLLATPLTFLDTEKELQIMVSIAYRLQLL